MIEITRSVAISPVRIQAPFNFDVIEVRRFDPTRYNVRWTVQVVTHKDMPLLHLGFRTLLRLAI